MRRRGTWLIAGRRADPVAPAPGHRSRRAPGGTAPQPSRRPLWATVAE